jgi:hypothetical protein
MPVRRIVVSESEEEGEQDGEPQAHGRSATLPSQRREHTLPPPPPGWTWDLKACASDGAPEGGAAARAAWPDEQVLDGMCLAHILRWLKDSRIKPKYVDFDGTYEAIKKDVLDLSGDVFIQELVRYTYEVRAAARLHCLQNCSSTHTVPASCPARARLPRRKCWPSGRSSARTGLLTRLTARGVHARSRGRR